MTTLDRQGLVQWDRRPKETNRNYQAFLVYRDQGVMRTTRRVADSFYRPHDWPRDLGYSASVAKLRVIQGWSSQFDWVARCEAWDAHVGVQLHLENTEAVKDMRRLQASTGRTMLRMAGNRLVQLERDPKAIALLSVRDLVALADLGAKLERLARGEPDSITGRPEDQEPDENDPVRINEHIRNLLTADPTLAVEYDRVAAKRSAAEAKLAGNPGMN